MDLTSGDVRHFYMEIKSAHVGTGISDLKTHLQLNWSNLCADKALRFLKDERTDSLQTE